MRMGLLWLGNTVLVFSAVCTASSERLIKRFEDDTPFSFVYGGKHSKAVISSWQKSKTIHALPGGRTLLTITYRDPETRLEATREITIFPGENAIEWVMTLHNGSSKDTPVLENILPLDAEISVPANDVVTFHHVYGSAANSRDYAPVDKDLIADASVSIKHYILDKGQH